MINTILKLPTLPTIPSLLTLPFILTLPLHQLIVVVRQKLRIDLTDEFEHNTDDDDQSGTGDNQIR